MSAENFLKKIMGLTEERIVKSRLELSSEALLEGISSSDKISLDFLAQFGAARSPRIIAEIKRKSPSRGDIALDLKVPDVAQAYARAGAAAISVLTEPNYFGGSVQDLRTVRNLLPKMPLLMKDFVFDSYQLLEARYYGADAVLLIHSLLGEDRLLELFHESRELGLTPLVEVHTEAELESALKIGAQLVGINNRNLKTLQVDLSTTTRLSSLFAAYESTTFIAESGLETTAQIKNLEHLGYKGFLIGTKLMSHKNPEEDLRKLNERAL